jgi:hypothetical protein
VAYEIRDSFRAYRTRIAAAAALAAVAAACPLETASAQGLFDFLFGGGSRRSSPPPTAYAPSNPLSGAVSRGDATGPEITRVPNGDTGRAVAFCVRTCDGRYFPLQRVSGSSPADVCRSFCPAAQTKVYNGSVIDHAVASDGTRYSSLKTAFVYRDKVVSDCTCTGKNSAGIARIDPKVDPTLRPGDIVATEDGLQAYTGGRNGQTASFTPVASYSGLSADLRQKLLMTKVTPVPASTITGPAPVPGADASKPVAETTGVAPRQETRRAQVR